MDSCEYCGASEEDEELEYCDELEIYFCDSGCRTDYEKSLRYVIYLKISVCKLFHCFYINLDTLNKFVEFQNEMPDIEYEIELIKYPRDVSGDNNIKDVIDFCLPPIKKNLEEKISQEQNRVSSINYNIDYLKKSLSEVCKLEQGNTKCI